MHCVEAVQCDILAGSQRGHDEWQAETHPRHTPLVVRDGDVESFTADGVFEPCLRTVLEATTVHAHRKNDVVLLPEVAVLDLFACHEEQVALPHSLLEQCGRLLIEKTAGAKSTGCRRLRLFNDDLPYLFD